MVLNITEKFKKIIITAHRTRSRGVHRKYYFSLPLDCFVFHQYFLDDTQSTTLKQFMVKKFWRILCQQKYQNKAPSEESHESWLQHSFLPLRRISLFLVFSWHWLSRAYSGSYSRPLVCCGGHFIKA